MTALLAGRLPGIVALGGSAALVYVYWLVPIGSITSAAAQPRAIALLAFLLTGLLVVEVAAAARRNRRKAEAAIADQRRRLVEREQAQAALARSEAQLRRALEELEAIVRVAPVGIAVARPERGEFTVNRQGREALGLPGEGRLELRSTLRELGLLAFRRNGEPVPPSDRPMERAIATGAPVSAELLEIETDRGRREALIGAVPLLDETGRTVGAVATIHDVTRLRATERQLATQEEWFRVAQESSRVAFTILRAVRDEAGAIVDFEWLYANPAAATVLKHPVEALVGHRLLEVLPGNREASPLFDAYVRVVETGEGHQIEVPYEADGIHGAFLNVCSRLDDGVAIWFMDVTERKLAERLLRESERRLQLVIEGARIGTWHADYATGRVVWSPHFAALQGFPSEPGDAVPPSRWLEVVHPDDRDWTAREIATARRERRVYQVESRIRRADTGEERWILAYGRFLWLEDERREVGMGLALDITDRKRTELELQRREAEFRSLFEMASTGSAQIDVATRRLVRVNERLCELTSYSAANLVGRAFGDLTDPDDRQREAALVEPVFRGERDHWQIDKRYRHADGRATWVQVSGTLLRDADGAPRSIIASIVDITARREAEQSLREADRRKDEFLATLAHELRNPLAPIRYAVRLLAPADSAGAAAQAREIVERQTALMGRLLDDLLDVSRITRDVVTLRREVLDLRRIVQHAADNVRPQAERLRHAVSVDLPDEPAWVNGDPARLHQVVDNLLQNAVKYTDPGGRIDVGLRTSAGHVVLAVQDTGIGLDAEARERIFELFAQVQAPGKGRGGLGIGLAVVKRLVELHGGTIAMHSAGPGRGSTFQVSLPGVSPHGAAAGTHSRVVPLFRPGVGVLLVDDNVDVVESLQLLLRSEGFAVHTASDGATAMRIAEAIRPSVVVLDLGMPEIDGYDVARWLRQQPWGGSVCLIAATGWGEAEERARTRAAGFDAHLVKPVDPDLLLQLISAGAAQPDSRSSSGHA